MTLSNEELENELKALRPTGTSEELEQEIEQELDATLDQGSKNIIRFWPIIAAAAAACLALVLVLSNPQNPETSNPAIESIASTESTAPESPDAFDEFQPVEAEQRLIEAIDDGVFLTADNEPIRKLRYQFIDTLTMVSQTDGSVFKMEIPREETLFIPVTLL